MKKKTLALFLVLALAFGGVIGGTVAWLTDKSDTVVNTFTDSDIDITLTESTGTEYKMVPGYTISKDPRLPSRLTARSAICSSSWISLIISIPS